MAASTSFRLSPLGTGCPLPRHSLWPYAHPAHLSTATARSRTAVLRSCWKEFEMKSAKTAAVGSGSKEFEMKSAKTAAVGSGSKEFEMKSSKTAPPVRSCSKEFEMKSVMPTETSLKLGIVGFGKFGQFLAERFVNHGHEVLAYSRSDYTGVARELRVTYFSDADDFCEEHPDVVILCTSILSTKEVIHALTMSIQRLKPDTLFVDVLSVKEFPKNLLLQVLPNEFDVLCTHPMFGPESGSGGWAGLPVMFEKVRIREVCMDRCTQFLNIFESEGCRMVEMSCEEHDRHTASSQFLTHTAGRIFAMLGLRPTPIDTKDYQHLLNLVHNVSSDSPDLYFGLLLHNKNAPKELVRLVGAVKYIITNIFYIMHNYGIQEMLQKKLLPSSLKAITKLTEKIIAISEKRSG